MTGQLPTLDDGIEILQAISDAVRAAHEAGSSDCARKMSKLAVRLATGLAERCPFIAAEPTRKETDS